ncbi:MAG: TIGR01906 family membrane protein [Erysipelotrichia bacterium]|nr:TIGR01906 family membrane protein [Erysipelotrichia bacterium]
MKKSKTLSLYIILMIIIFIITFSVSIPILFRPFYYFHIKSLDLVNITGLDYQTIKTAYDEMMNFCLGLTNSFSTGILKYSDEGMAHFIDVKNLFILDLALLLFSTLNLIFVPKIFKKRAIIPYKFNGNGNSYYAATILLTVFIGIILFTLPDFSRTFTIFHQIFFPGKTNWLFDSRYDEIIIILPETFFMNCAILIVSILIFICLFLIIKNKKNVFNSN